jgi:hypothetical protein
MDLKWLLSRYEKVWFSKFLCRIVAGACLTASPVAFSTSADSPTPAAKFLPSIP